MSSNAVGTYVRGGALGAPGAAAPDLGTSLSTAGIAWGNKVLEWTDLPEPVQAANRGGTVLVEGVNVTPGGRRLDGVVHQVMYGWRAWDDLVVVVTVTRPLARRSDGKLVPAGPWAERSTDEYASTSPAAHTRSKIATGHTHQAADVAGPGGEVPRDMLHAADIFGYLPAPARGRLVKDVPVPTVWLGELSRWTITGTPAVEQELVMLRVGGTTAIALKAVRTGLPDKLAAQEWVIDRHTYTLTSGPLALGSSSVNANQIGR